MCWGLSASVAMAGVGTAGAVITARQGRPAAIPLTIGYFALMEALQAFGYMVVDECGSPWNQSVTIVSVLHIVFQPFFVNAFAMELVPREVRDRVRMPVYALCGAGAVLMLMQLYPFEWAGSCRAGSTLCGADLCTVSGDWHIGWDVPFNGILEPLQRLTGISMAFPGYTLTVFVVPLFYGAWRFVALHAVLGPLAAMALTGGPNEMPAVWCLFAIGILLVSLSPWLWRRFERQSPVAA